MRCIRFLLLLTVLAAGIPSSFAQEEPNITTLAWSPDGNIIASVMDNGYLQIWNPITGELINQFQAHESVINTISWHPNSILLATTSPIDKTTRIWNTITSEEITELAGHDYYEGLAFVDWNPTGTYLVTVASVIDGGANLQFWDIEEDVYQLLPITAQVSVYDIAWSPTGTQLAISQFPGISIIDEFSYPSLEPRIISPFAPLIAWSPDETKIAAVDVINGIIAVLNVNTGEILLQIQSAERTLDNGISSIIWSPDGAVLITDHFNGAIQSWDANTGQFIEIQEINNRQGSRFLISLSPYGGRLAVGNNTRSTEASDRSITQNIIPDLADGLIQIIVPAPSLDRLHAIAQLCGAPADLHLDSLESFTAQLDTLDIPPACRADLLAIATALQEE